MSKTVEQRVVEMRFDNQNFEKNVRATMLSLDRLKQKLNITSASKSLENIDRVASKVSLNGITNAVENVGHKFSALEVMGITALSNITSAAMNAGSRILQALTILPSKSGFDEYETKINAIQTIMSNTASKGTTMDDVTKTLDELNTYADKTIYNFAEMTRNIGTFTAAGVGLEESASAIQGIANLAAASGSSSQQASTAMYQLSQALASGTVKLMDWNSVVNAGMGGQKFQDALKATAREHGVAVDQIIKEQGSFRESLSEGWLTADILNETLNKFTVDGAKKYSAAMIESGKWTQEQADALIKEAQAMEDAATKVKTFTQLWSTLNESMQSGWAKSWEIIIGNFEEAKDFLTEVSDTLGKVLNDSADARNKVLQDWKDLGGRQVIIDGLRNAFEAFVRLAKPIREAFREVFPRKTGQDLLKISERFKAFTERMKISDETAKKLKSAFKGLFGMVSLMNTIMAPFWKALWKIHCILGDFFRDVLLSGASLGDYIVKVRDAVRENNILANYCEWLINIVQKATDKMREFGKALKDGFKAEGYEGIMGFFKGLYELVKSLSKGVAVFFGGIGKAIANAFKKNNVVDVVNSGMFSVVLAGMIKFINNINGPLSSLKAIFDRIGGKNGLIYKIAGKNGILSQVVDCLEAYQQQLEAKTLLRIAGAIAILAGSILILSSIDSDALGRSLGGLTVLFGELMGGMYLFTKIPSLKGAWRAIPLMFGMSSALLTMSLALKVISTMSFGEMMTGLVGVAGAMGVLIGALHLLPNGDMKKIKQASKSIRTLSTSLLILSAAMKVMGSMSWNEIAKGLTGAVGGLGAMVGAIHLLPKDAPRKTLGLIGLSTALVILGGAMKIMGSMNWSEIGKGLTVLAGSLVAVTTAMNFIPKGMVTKGVGLIAVATALTILAHALDKMSSMSWGEIGKGMTVLGGALLVLSIGLNSMKGTLGASVAITNVVAALGGLTIILKSLGGMKWGTIIKSLVTLASAFAILGVASKLLTPLIPSMLALAGSFALIGVATLALGGGLMLVGLGIASIAGSLAAGATAIVASLTVIITGILDLVPTIATKLAEGIAAFAKVIGDSAPLIADSVLKLIAEVLKSAAKYIPIIANSLFELLIGVIDVLADRMPELVTSMAGLFNGLFVGTAEALKGLDGANLLKGTLAVGLMAGLTYVLAGIGGMIGPAMLGLLGVGALIAELALVLAAVGALSKIPGLSWLVEEGGYFLEKIGTALGQFVGGFAGGIAQGFTSSLPAIGTDLTDFMTNVQPFIDGVKKIDNKMFDGVKSLVEALMLLTGANIVKSLTKFITGGSSLSDLGEQLIPFGESMKKYAKVVSGVDSKAILESSYAAKALVSVANNIPNSGGLAKLFAGDNDLETFGTQLVPFGEGLTKYASVVSGIDTKAITESAAAAKALVEVTNAIPNQGGMVAWFTGDNSLAKFSLEMITLGGGLKGFSKAIDGIVPENIKAAAGAAKALAEMMNVIPNEGGMLAWLTGDNSVVNFANDLTSLGYGLSNFSILTENIVPENIKAAASAAKALAEMTTYIPNEGGMVAWFTGDNSLSKFANHLPTLGEGLAKFSTEVADINPENVTAAANAAKSIAEMSDHIPNQGGMVAWFTGENSLATFADKLPTLGEGLAKFSTEVADINPDNVIAASGAAKALAEMADIIPNEGGMVAWFTGENSVASFADKLPTLGEGLAGFATEVADINPENVTAAANAAKALAEMADTAPKNSKKMITFGENLGTFAEKLKTYFNKTSAIKVETIESTTKAIASIKTATEGINSSTISSAAKSIKEFTKSIKDISGVSEKSVKGFIKAMKELGKTNVNEVADEFKHAGPILKDAGQSAIKKLAEGIKNEESSVKSACSKIVNVLNDCKNNLNKYDNHFYLIGERLVDGFARGISENTYKSTAKANAMAVAAKQAAERVLGIHSPSRVFYKIGSYVTKGFTKALNDGEHDIYDASGSMAESARKGMTSAISKVTELLNNNMDSQPVIRPVLDLSDIQSGAGSINGLFSNVGVGANLRAISSGMNSRSQNGVNSDVVSAIDKLRKDLGNVGGNTYNVNGVTYDDGSNITEAVKTIVRAAITERRI